MQSEVCSIVNLDLRTLYAALTMSLNFQKLAATETDIRQRPLSNLRMNGPWRSRTANSAVIEYKTHRYCLAALTRDEQSRL